MKRLNSTPELVGRSDVARHMHDVIDALARHDCTVLIEGESGSGKEVAARRIHARSRRREGPFVPVDCTTLTDRLFESQLFGHVRGAFTGADRSTLGFFRAADGGTLFLDEIGEMQLPIQAKLLRCIQERAVVPLGQTAAIQADVRVIVATNRSLRDMVARGEFREDLYFRLNVGSLNVPPLRDRRADIPELATRLFADLCKADDYDQSPPPISEEAMLALRAYDWPGNVRELMNAMEHALVFMRGNELGLCDLPDAVQRRGRARPGNDAIMPLEDVERDLIERTLRFTRGNQSQAASMLAIERHRLHRRIVRYGLENLVRPQSH